MEELIVIVVKGLFTNRADKGMRDTPLCWYVKYISICIYKCTQFLRVQYRPVSISSAQQDIFRQSDVVIKMHEAELNLACPFPSP